MEFSVIIPTSRRPDALLRAVRCWLKVDFPASQFEIIVVDDEGRGAARRALQGVMGTDGPVLRVLDGHGAGAFAARNLGASAASGRIVVFSDDDIAVHPDHFEEQLRTRRLCGNDCLVSAMWHYSPIVAERLSRYSFGRLLLERVEEDQQCLRHVAGSCWETDAADSCNLSVERRTFEKLGTFGNLPGAGYWVDCAFAWRARRKGVQLIINRDLVVDSDDSRVSLRQFCEREERVAADYAKLSSTMPKEFGRLQYFVDSGGPRRSDPARIRAKKRGKELLAGRPCLEALVWTGETGDRLRLPDRILHPYFARVMALHTVRGIRGAEGISASSTGPAAPWPQACR